VIAAIVAMDRTSLIGRRGALPWHYPEDLAYFKRITLNQTVLMGRKTYESIVKQLGKALPQRRNIVLSTTLKDTDGVEVIQKLDEFLASHPKTSTLFIIGGAKVYQAALPYCDRLYITHIEEIYEGDTYFPTIDWAEWHIIEKKTQGVLTFAVYERKNPWQPSST